MTGILCDWLNREVKLSRTVDVESFAREFSSGYLIGELLNKYELQEDFDQFSQSRLANAKLNNFSRMEPTLQLLGVQFDQNVARNIMTEQHGAAIKLVYQLYVALEKKKKAGLTGVAMDAMRPSANAKLKSVGTEIYRERLKTLVPRQADLSLQQISDSFQNKAKILESKIVGMHFVKQQQAKQIQEEKKAEELERKIAEKCRQNEIMAKIQAAVIQIPKPLPQHTDKAIEDQKLQKKKKEADITYTEIRNFEKQMRKEAVVPARLTESMAIAIKQAQELAMAKPAITDLLNTYSDDEYIRKIQKRLEEDTFAREQREKRRRKMLREQLIAHEAQEEAYREEQLINRLMRQSQQERRIAVQLMHVRHEKEVLWQNRIYREKQFEERRLKEFQEALDREEALAKQEKIELAEQALREKQLHAKLAAERAEARYQKHYEICWEVVEQIIDLATKIGEYRTLTNNLIPSKLMRDWKELFLKGKPIYEQADISLLPDEPTPEQLVELDKINLLDEKDYDEYKAMVEEWYPPEEIRVNKPPPDNVILGHVIHRLMELVYPPELEPPPSIFSPFPIKGCILGKLYSGKTTCLNFLGKVFNIQVLSLDALIAQAIKSFHENEIAVENIFPATMEDSSLNQLHVLKEASKASLVILKSYESAEQNIPIEEPKESIEKPGSAVMTDQVEISEDEDESKLSIRAQLGAGAETLLKKGKNIPDELLVGIMVEAISRLQPEKGWIMDGFPMTLNQAKLLEKALTRRDPDQTEINTINLKKPTLVTDPAAPKEPPVHPPGLDFAILLDVTDSIVLNRIATEKVDSYQREHKTTAHISETKIQQREKLKSEWGQMQHRIIGFLDNWPQLEAWYSEQQNILTKVNADIEETLMCQRIKEILTGEIIKIQNKGKEKEKLEAEKQKEDIHLLPEESFIEKMEEAALLSELQEPPPPPPAPKETTPSELPAKGKKGKKDETVKGKESTAKSGTPRAKGQTKSMSSSPEDMLPTNAVEPPPIKPGSSEWIYCDDPIPQEIAEFLVPYWETIEKTYVNNIKATLRCLRDEQHVIIHYLSDIRNHFKDYLKRPDHKQEFVTQWQVDYNSVTDDLWDDDETKEELHQRVTDLRDRLWDICENRRDEAEQERCDIMNDGWLPDRIGLLMNHIFSLMQNEMDRFQDTKKLLHDYYRAMEGKIPSEITSDFTRIPLIDLMERRMSAEECKMKIIPTIAHRSTSPEVNRERIKLIPVKLKDDLFSESVIFNFSPDEKLLTETWHHITTTISSMVSAEIQTKEAEEEKERLLEEMKEKERLKSSQAIPGKGGKEGKGKGGKGEKEAKGGKEAKDKESKDAKKGKKKGTGSPSMTEVIATPLSPEELKKQELKLKMKQEYFAALEHEAEAAKSRLELLKVKGLAFLEDLQSKAEETYRNMEKWLGERFLAEMSSVDKLIGVARNRIETSSRIQFELVLEGIDFYVNGDIKVFEDPPIPPRPPSVETATNNALTISQLSTLHKQFLQVAPKAIAALKQLKRKNVTPGKPSYSKKSHQFPKIWMLKYTWLKYDSDKCIMYCALCRKHNVDLGEKTHNLCSGTDDFILELVDEHNNSEAHAWASCMEAASKSTPDSDTTQHMLKNMSKTTLGKIENLFRTCHAIAKTGRPFTDLDWISKLDDTKGLDIGSIFRNDKAARIFIHFIAEVERRALKEKLEKCKFFSLISDGITDNGTTEAALVYIQFAHQGKIHCQIVGIQSIDMYDALTVKNAILKSLQTNLKVNLPTHDWARKLVGFGSDGRDVMVGENGVAKLLKDIQPCIQSIHCLVHRLEMAYKIALKNTPLFNTLTDLLNNLYYFYHESPMNKNNLKLICEAHKVTPVVPSRIGGSQWFLRLQTALQILLKAYPAILLHLSKMGEESDSSNQQKAKDLLKFLLKTDMVKFSHFLLDVINVLNILSRVAHNPNTSIADVFATIQSTLEILQMYQERSGPRERLVEKITYFHGYPLVGDGNISETRFELLSSLLNQLRDCFCDASEDVLIASAIGSFKLWPDRFKQEFGETELSLLIQHYEPVLEWAKVKVDEIETEWNMLKAELYNRYENIWTLTWDLVNRDFFHKYPNVLALIDLLLTLPASSSEAARGFGQMKLTMMRLHSKLMFESMTDLIVIQLNSPEIKKFDPQKAVQLWNVSWQRNRKLQANQGDPRGIPIGLSPCANSDSSSDSEWEKESSFGSLIPSKTFIDILFDLITLNLGSNMLPDAWLHLSMYDLQSLSLFLLVNLDTVDWRRFLHAASQPWPIPSTTELLETLQRFQDVDTEGSGFVTQEQYEQVGLWFKGREDLGIPESPIEPLPFNRQKHLIEFLFTLFAEPEKDPPQLNYTKMLLYFASYPDAIDGVYRALSVATGIYIQRKREKHFSQMYVTSAEQLITPAAHEEQAEEEAGEEGEEEEEEEKEEKEEDVLSIGNDGYISLATLLLVFQYETNKALDNHRFSSQLTEEDNYEHFIKVYKDLGSEELKPIKINLLLKHPFIQDLINNYQGYKLPDFKMILQRAVQVQPLNGDNITL